jgi:hypothetical protein
LFPHPVRSKSFLATSATNRAMTEQQFIVLEQRHIPAGARAWKKPVSFLHIP